MECLHFIVPHRRLYKPEFGSVVPEKIANGVYVVLGQTLKGLGLGFRDQGLGLGVGVRV